MSSKAVTIFLAAIVLSFFGLVLNGCKRQVDPATGRPVTTLGTLQNPVDRAAEACKAGGKTLKSYKDTSSGVEFTCE